MLKPNTKSIKSARLSIAVFSTLIVATTLSFTICANLTVKADTTIEDTVTITVDSACTLSGVVPSGSEHTATITPGQNVPNIGITNMTAVCNDASGYDIYAVGYSNDEWKNTNLISEQSGTTYTIPTGTATSGNNSNWSMKLAAGTGDAATIVTTPVDYSNYANVPNDYVKVAYYPSSTAGTSGSSFTTTYQVFASTSQTAGTYAGKVKYTLVHPNNAPAPEVPIVCNPSGTTISDIVCMQDIGSANKSSVLASMTENTQYQLYDSRDGNIYTVAKLADGNIWMTQNLDLFIDSTKTYTSADTDISSPWTPSTSTYATGVTTWNTSSYTATPESYDPGNLCWNGTLDPDYSTTLDTGTVTCTDDKHYSIGNYYNWTAAVAMNDSSSYVSQNQDVDQSICPAGWMLPKSGTILTGSGSFSYLVNQLSLTAGAGGNIQNSPVFFPYAGGWFGTSYYVGSASILWSSVVAGGDGKEVHSLYFNSAGDLDPQENNFRSAGVSVRCVAR